MRNILITIITLILLFTFSISQESDYGEITIAKVKYSGGGDWYANPTSLLNLHREVEERTGIDMKELKEDVVITLLDPELSRYPIINITGHGNIILSELERKNLVAYLNNGGFLHIDDNYGLDQHIRPLLEDIFGKDCLVELPADHEIYHCFYDMENGLPKIHEHHGGPPRGYGVFLEGRMVVYYTYNTDLSDGWEDPSVHEDPADKRELAFRMGTNIVVYALTH
jgi:hypothetical protein